MTSKCLTKCKKSSNSANILTLPEILVWGFNLQTAQPTNLPQSVIISGLPDGAYIVKISNGGVSSLILDNFGNVYSQGDNTFGQLANGSTVNQTDYRPIDISSLPLGTKFKDISMSTNASIFLTTTGKVYTAGLNNFGQLGIGSFGGPSAVPVPVVTTGILNGKNIVSVSMGTDQGLGAAAAALSDDGIVYTWGRGGFGQLGNGSAANQNAPVQVLTATRYSFVYSGFGNMIAITKAGTLNTWGRNIAGTLGNGTLIGSAIPVNVVGVTGKQFVSATIARDVAGAVTTNGEVYTWGTNTGGALGQGLALGAQVLTAQQVNGIISGIRMKQIVALTNASYMMVLSETGYVYTWGDNSLGNLGNGTFVNSNVPTGAVAGLLSDKVVTQITAAGESAVLAQLTHYQAF